MEGVAGQEAAAKRANLMAQRQEAQEDLDETVREHITSMQIEGLDDMMTGLKDNLEDWKEKLHSDMDYQNEVINDAINRVNDKNSDGSIANLLSGISQTQITATQVSDLLNTVSNTLENAINNIDSRGSQTPNTSGGSEDGGSGGGTSGGGGTSSGGTSGGGTSGGGTSSGGTSGSGSAGGVAKAKKTVTDANAKKAFDYILKHLTYSDKEGKGWGTLNKTLWHHKNFNRKVYIPKKYEEGAWKLLGLGSKYGGNVALMNALKSTGIWSELLKVRWDAKKKKLNTSGINSKNVHGYAKGGIVSRSGHYLTDENGEEIIVTKQGILRPLSAGTSVIPSDITERLYAMASDYGGVRSSFGTSKFTRIGGQNISPIINCPITIEGNANEQDVINAINKTLPKISKHVQNDIRKDLRKSGR